jgi:hypothetical protein
MRILRRFLARVKNFAMGQRSREFGIRERSCGRWLADNLTRMRDRHTRRRALSDRRLESLTIAGQTG